jgi:hypothetical protein
VSQKSFRRTSVFFGAILTTIFLASSATMATVVTLPGTVPGSGTSFAFGQDGSSRYFALGGIYGVNGDYQADVSSDGGLDVHIMNFPTNNHISSTALETGHVIKASAGTLFGFYCNAITGGASGYCIAVNSATVPSTGTITGVLDNCYFSTPAGCSFSRIPAGVAYGTGISILISTAASPFTYTTGTDTGFIGADFQ